MLVHIFSNCKNYSWPPTAGSVFSTSAINPYLCAKRALVLMILHTIENNDYRVDIHDNNYLEYYAKPGALIDASSVRDCKEKVVAFKPGAKYFVYAEGVEFFTFTKEARAIVSSAEHLDNVYANAFYTTNVSLLLLSEIFHKLYKPAVPTKTFTSREAAKKWLEEQRAKLLRSE